MSWLLDNFDLLGSRVAIIHDSTEYDYQSLAEEIRKKRNDFEKNPVVDQSKITLLESDYSFDGVTTFFALMLLKKIIVPVANATKEEFENRAQICRAQVHIVVRDHGIDVTETNTGATDVPDLCEKLVVEKQAGLILFSSGTSGEPKAMVHNLDNLVQSFRSDRNRSSRILVFLLFDHIGGLNTLLSGLIKGTTLVFPSGRSPGAVARLIEMHRVRVLPTSPSFLNLLLLSNVCADYDLASLRLITYGTEPMPVDLLPRLKETFPRAKLVQTYGTSETGIAQTQSSSSLSVDFKISDSSIESKIVDDELWLKSPTRVLGYINFDEDQFTDDGWYRTGDLVETGEGGFYKIKGRKSDIINVGGEKVFPTEIEDCILSNPEITDCLVTGKPNVITGQTVVAKVVPATDLPPAVVRKIVRDWCHERLSKYKVPSKVTVVSELPVGERFKKIRHS